MVKGSATIVSPPQKCDFHRPNREEITKRLHKIAEKEKVDLERDAAQIIALAAEGSMRDAESILGEIMAVEDKKITRAEVENILGLPRREAAKQLFQFIAAKDIPSSLALIQQLTEGGYDLGYFAKLLMHYFRNAYFLKTDPALKRFVESEMLPDEYECITTNLARFEAQDLSRGLDVILQNLQSFRKTPIPQLPLELTVIELINGGK